MRDIRQIAQTLGGDVIGADSANVPGPGHGPADRSLSIKLNARAPGGFVVFSHAGDDPIECRDYVRGKLGLAAWRPGDGDARVPFVVSQDNRDDDKDRLKSLALKIWQESVNPAGAIVERYLLEHRGLVLPATAANTAVRFHGSLYVDKFTRMPGMVCLLRNIQTDEPTGIHRTFLDRKTAAKVDRKMLGVAKGAAVKIDTDIQSSLTVGEGVETVLSARAAGFGPVWALGSSGAVKAFPVLAGLAELTLLEENDPTSRRDVKTCAKRYLEARRPVNILTSHVGNDFNDAWRAMK
jgi:putative DNA primase/helicase